MSLPNTDAQTITSVLDEAALKELVVLLDETHPQIVLTAFQNIADDDAAVFFVMCVHLKSDLIGNALTAHAGKLFAELPFDRQVGIAQSVTATEVVAAERAARIWHEHIAKIKETLRQTTFLGEGSVNLAKLLSYMDVAEQNQLLEALTEQNPTLVNRISEQLFTFGDLDKLENEAIKTVLKVLDKQTLAIALHNGPAAVHDRFFENMSASEAEALQSEITELTFEQTHIAETARQSIVHLVRNFAAKGLLKIQ